MARRRSATPNRNEDGDGHTRDASPVRKGKRNHQRELSPDQNQSQSRKGKQQPQQLPLAGFWPQFQQKASSVLSTFREPMRYLRQPMRYLRQPMQYLRQPIQMVRNHMYAAISIAVFAVLIGGLITGYSAYRVRQQNQGFIPRMKNAAQGAFDQVRHQGESYMDTALHGFEETAAPVKKAFLNAKDKVAEVTGMAQRKPETVLDTARHQFEDFTTNAMKTAEGLGSNVKSVIDSTTGYFNKGSDDLTTSLKHNAEKFAHDAYETAAHAAQATKEAAMHAADIASKKGEGLTAATKKKAEELTGLTQQKREELAIKAKKTVESQSAAAKHKIDEAAAAAKKRVDDLADQAKKAADKSAGHSTWKFW